MRRLPLLNCKANPVLCLWQGFGYFDESTNHNVLKSVADILDFGGRLILDIYNHDFEVAIGQRSARLLDPSASHAYHFVTGPVLK
jgi:hypothetical protein